MDTIAITGFTDPLSSLTHLMGALVALVYTVVIARKSIPTGPLRTVGAIVFGLSAVVLLTVSGTYHLLDAGSTARAVFRRLDHAAIFVLIAGTFTPPLIDFFGARPRWLMLAFVWTTAFSGVVMKLVFFDQISEGLGLILYLGLGWWGLITALMMIRVYPWRPFLPLLYGGVLYSLGAVCEFLRWPVVVDGVLGPHELFHVLVLAGLGAHAHFIFRQADGPWIQQRQSSGEKK